MKNDWRTILINSTLIFFSFGFLFSCNKPPIYYDNGTIKCLGTPIGAEYFVKEVNKTILVVNREMLKEQISTGSDLSRVCTSNITNMGVEYLNHILIKGSSLFYNSNINQNISSWDVSNVTDMSFMFSSSQFNQPIGNWDVSNVTNMSHMFRDSQFNQPIGDWDVSNVINMRYMFWGSQFNQPIGDWDVSNVFNTNSMFVESKFNQPIGNWDVSNVIDMKGMFAESTFNQPIGEWDVSNVTYMSFIFEDSQFNQPINGWCVSQIPSEPSSFSAGSPLTEENKPIWGTCPD